MTQESSAELEKLERQLGEAKNLQELWENEKENLASAMDILKDIINRRELSHADIVTLIEKIMIYERREGVRYRGCMEYAVCNK